MDEDFLLNKIWGVWTGKIAGGTFGQPVEGKEKEDIQDAKPPLAGWTPAHLSFINFPNDDEQYELVALLALENLNDEQLEQKLKSNTLLSREYLGTYWLEYLKRSYMFTAEEYAYKFVKRWKLPWRYAGDALYIDPQDNKAYGNPYFDWIGAQMKGEIFGMLSPAWNWYLNQKNSPEQDLILLKPCLDLSLQDALMAHRGVAVVGELFISAMIAVAIVHDPFNYQEETTYSNLTNDDLQKSRNKIKQVGICSERIISDIKRIKQVLLKYEGIETSNVELYFSFIDPVIDYYEKDHNPVRWEETWQKCSELWNAFEQEMIEDAKKRYMDYPDLLKRRLKAINFEVQGERRNIHTLFNNSAIIIGLLYGDGDITQAIRISTECGEDTDCNAGNAGAIMGAYLGQNLIPTYLKRFIQDEIKPAIKKWKDKSIYNLSKRTVSQSLRIYNSYNH
ncbi:MAG: ADP-ribosylglycohydrolase family protein [Promethearchaeota archaeon]|nr:MAG: ADP-ribosylglycohydrolase family protein [Candidatus Lokiarchaeota archaeon]